MLLSSYLASNRLTLAKFADQIGVSAPAVHRYAHGRVPAPAIMRRIMLATGGAVGPADFYSVAQTQADGSEDHAAGDQS